MAMAPLSRIFLMVPGASAARAGPASRRRIRVNAVTRIVRSPWPGGPPRSREPGDVGQVAVALLAVEAVADHEHVGDLPAHVIEPDVGGPGALLGEEGADPERRRVARLEVPQEVRQGEAARTDALDDQHVPPLDGVVEVLLDADDARGAGLRVGDDRDE